MLLPARIAIALCDDGWWLRDEIIWHKPNPMPSPGRGRTTPAHEMLYCLTKSAHYWFDQDAYREPAAIADWNDGSRVYGGVNKAGANAKHGERTTGRRTGKIKVPGGWDKGPGGHGTIHRGGRTEAQYVEAACSDFRNKRSVWTVATSPFSEAHFATFPPDLIEPCILAGCPAGGTVLDPFGGAGTTGMVADRLGRDAILIELNPEYAAIAERRIKGDAGMFASVAAE
jgi:DNA modification methylase